MVRWSAIWSNPFNMDICSLVVFQHDSEPVLPGRSCSMFLHTQICDSPFHRPVSLADVIISPGLTSAQVPQRPNVSQCLALSPGFISCCRPHVYITCSGTHGYACAVWSPWSRLIHVRAGVYFCWAPIRPDATCMLNICVFRGASQCKRVQATFHMSV